jgi:16S rRNA (cytosine1402-N4)-methyltransferase
MRHSAAAAFDLQESDSQLSLPGLADQWVWCEEEEDVVAFTHETVMRSEVAFALGSRPGGTYVDATVGGGGHSEEILQRAEGSRVIAFDRDTSALDASRSRLARFGDRVTFVHASFGTIEAQLQALGISAIDGLCADLGLSSPQIDDPARGMSFRAEGPLDMRMDTSGGETAKELIARLSESDLADVIYKYGEERRSRRIARSIKRAHDAGELATTLDLRRAVVRAVGPMRVGGIDPATRTFQALRIAVNDELGEIERLLASAPRVLASGGVCAIVSFHSLEDRIVKQAFHDRETWEVLWKKPLVPSDEEQAKNPRSRSAKLRAARRR